MSTVQDFYPARRSQLSFYRDIPLYQKVKDGGFVLYKAAGQMLPEIRLDKDRLPEILYINRMDRLKGLQEAQRAFNLEIKDHLLNKNPEKLKNTIVSIVTETLAEPRSGSLEGLKQTANVLVDQYVTDIDIIKKLLFVPDTDYTTVVHSINVMALSLVYASYAGFSQARKRVICLCALLHDVGKTRISQELLTMPRKLTDVEFAEIKRHPKLGYDILSHCRFGSHEIKCVALEHHEKLDGTGYPLSISNISEISQIIAFVDCYEALTNNDRPYRRALDPARALFIIKKDVMAGKFSKELFKDFTKSLNS